MGDGDGASGGGTPPVSIDDFKNLETILTSSMNTQMEELRAMIRQLLNANKPPAASSLEANASAAHSGEGEQLTNESSPKIDSGKDEYHGVPFRYSVDHLSRIMI